MFKSLITSIAIMLCIACSAKATVAITQQNSQSFILHNASKSVVRVNIELVDENKVTITGNGSGVSIGAGIVVTCGHVVDGATRVSIDDGDGHKVDISKDNIYVNPDRDVAILVTEDPVFEKMEGIKINTQYDKHIYETVFTLGSPLNKFNLASMGILGGTVSLEGYDHLLLVAPTSPGSSGGAILDQNGALLGIVRGGYTDGDCISIGVPSKYIMETMILAMSRPSKEK